MDVVPSDPTAYQRQEYWDERYTKEEEKTFDWFKRYEDLKILLNKYIPDKNSRILMLGCGNSTLSQDMYNDGYHNIENVDFSPVVIEHMQKRCIEMRGMTWKVMDILNLEYPDGSFDYAIDKGTMDALMCSKGDVWDPEPEIVEKCKRYINEVERVVRKSFIYITFGQKHFRQRHLERDSWNIQSFSYKKTYAIMSANGASTVDKNVEMWKVKKLIKSLEAARGNGTSMISLILPPGDQVSRVTRMLAEEYGTASNIKSRVNRLSVLAAITSAQQRLKLYNKVPPNGLIIYCGTIITDEGKERKVTVDFEPFKAINTSLYRCDNKFQTEALSELLESDDKFGFIIMDGNGALFGTLTGNTRDIIHKMTVDLPKKHGRGGQSALRFARLREEKRHNYVRKVAELAVQFYITNDKVNVAGLILAGSADFKTELGQSDMFDQRLQAKIIKVVDVSYGGENGFNQAIDLSAESLANVKFIQEKKLIQHYFDEISLDTGKYCFGIDDTLKGLELGAVETLIVWENLDVSRWIMRNSAGEEIILHTTKEQEKKRELFLDKETGVEMESQEKTSLLEWFAENYKNFGATLEFVTNRSQEGSQFVKGFGGIGGLLRYKVDFAQLNSFEDSDDEYYSD